VTKTEFNNLKVGDSIYYFTGFDNRINSMIIMLLEFSSNYVYMNELVYSKEHFLFSFDITEKKCLLNYLRQNENLRNKYSEFIKENMEYFI
jgi:hypothetical protein